mmetsp:Transcript_52898/g.146563  ORF Transcript_52898/g.146563 Transcript_52898/m.146563 type:complete len:209 (+) Transcript_52898:109-735(+)
MPAAAVRSAATVWAAQRPLPSGASLQTQVARPSGDAAKATRLPTVTFGGLSEGKNQASSPKAAVMFSQSMNNLNGASVDCLATIPTKATAAPPPLPPPDLPWPMVALPWPMAALPWPMATLPLTLPLSLPFPLSGIILSTRPTMRTLVASGRCPSRSMTLNVTLSQTCAPALLLPFKIMASMPYLSVTRPDLISRFPVLGPTLCTSPA